MSAAQNLNSYVDQHRLSLKLKPVLVGELFLARKLNHPVFIFRQGVFQPVIQSGEAPTKDQVNALIRNSHREVYLFPEDIQEIKKNLEAGLVKSTRSLSVGDPLENGNKVLKLLTLNLDELYENPHDDDLLMLQFQSTQNLSKFLIENKRFQPHFFQNLLRESFHFTLSQPMLSSVLMLSFLQSIHLFHDKEIENLFLSSYLKDIGISLIPDEKYDLKTLTTRDQDLFANHADFSFDLLEGRIPLSKNYLTIVKHHHFLNDKMKEMLSKNYKKTKETEMVYGLESTLVSVFDILVAMTSERPYRKSTTLYQALEIIRRMMADEYPQEFKALVIFLKHFYKN
jgi:hypothetical protein